MRQHKLHAGPGSSYYFTIALFTLGLMNYIIYISPVYTTTFRTGLHGQVSGASPVINCSVNGYKSGPGQFTLYYLYG